MHRITLTLLFALTLSLCAWSETVQVEDSNRTLIFAGKGRDFVISGDHNKIRISGVVGSITVQGHDQAIKLDVARQVHILGHSQRVNVRHARTASVNGFDNSLVVHNDTFIAHGGERNRVYTSYPKRVTRGQDGLSSLMSQLLRPITLLGLGDYFSNEIG